MNRSSKTRITRGREGDSIKNLGKALLQGKGATFGHDALHEIIQYTEALLRVAEENVEEIEDHTAMADLLKSGSEASDADLHFSIKPHEVRTWDAFFDLYCNHQAQGPSVAKQVLEWMRFTAPDSHQHPLHFQRDPKRDYSQCLDYDSGFYLFSGMLSESRIREYAKPFFFHLIATIERLKTCGRQRTSAKLSSADVGAISVLLDEFFKTSQSSVNAAKVFSKSFADARKTIDTAAQAGKSLTMSRLDLRAISISFDSVSIPKPLNSSTTSKNSNSSTREDKDLNFESMPDHDAEARPQSDPKEVSKAMKKRVLNFQAKAKQERELTIDIRAACEIFSVCHTLFLHGYTPIDWTKDPSHSQVTALRKINQAMNPDVKQRITLNTEETRSISAIFDTIPQYLEGFLNMNEESSSTGDSLTDKSDSAPNPASQNTGKSPWGQITVKGLSGEDFQSEDYCSLEQELKEFHDILGDKILAIINVLLDDIDNDLLRLPNVSHPFLFQLSLVENGIANLKERNQNAVADFESSVSKRKLAAETRASTLLLELAESTRSSGEAYSKLKAESNQTMSRLEIQLQLRNSEFEKLKTANAKQQGSLESALSITKREARNWESKFNAEAANNRVLRLDYDALSQKFEALTTKSQNLSTQSDSRLAAKDEELAILRSRRFHPNVEKNVVARAVANALAIKQVELDVKQQELDTTKALLINQVDLEARPRALVIKEGELERERIRLEIFQEQHDETMKARNLQIADLKESLAVMENLSAESRGVSKPNNLS